MPILIQVQTNHGIVYVWTQPIICLLLFRVKINTRVNKKNLHIENFTRLHLLVYNNIWFNFLKNFLQCYFLYSNSIVKKSPLEIWY